MLEIRRLEPLDLADVVVAAFGADTPAAATAFPLLGDIEAIDFPTIDLFELIALDGIVEEIGEVRPQVQSVVDRIGIRFQIAAECRPLPSTGHAVTRAAAAIGGSSCPNWSIIP